MLPSMMTLVVIAATILGGAMAVPQAWKVVRTRSTRGVSGVWAAVSTTINLWWAAYAFGVGDIAIFPVAAISVMAYLVITTAIVRYGDHPARSIVVPMALCSTAIALIPLAALALGGWTVAGLVLGALYGVQLSPAVLAVYRSADVSGVSIATWALALAEAVLWGAYGIVRVDAGIVALAVTGSIASSLVLARLFARRPRRERSFGPVFAPA